MVRPKRGKIRSLALVVGLLVALVAGVGCDKIRPPVPPGATPCPQADPSQTPQDCNKPAHRLRFASQIISDQDETLEISWTAGAETKSGIILNYPGGSHVSYAESVDNVPDGAVATIDVISLRGDARTRLQCFIFDFGAKRGGGTPVIQKTVNGDQACGLVYVVGTM